MIRALSIKNGRRFSTSAKKITVIGSGNWGCAIAKIVAENAAEHSQFSSEVKMWVFDEKVNGESLVDIINSKNENVKYLPGVNLPSNLIAERDLQTSVQDADLLIFISPHQFLPRVCDDILPVLKSNAAGLTCIKGMFVKGDDIKLPSAYLNSRLNIPVSALSGANIAKDVAAEEMSEATIGTANEEAELWKSLFSRPYFSIRTVPDIEGVEACGALKNVVALAAGFVDGMGLGSNTKSAVIRMGMAEIIRLSQTFFGETVQSSTFWESCGIADLITTCFSGRNRKCAEAFAKTGDSWDKIEADLLNGQKLQGTLTTMEVYEAMEALGVVNQFPFFAKVHGICFKGEKVESLLELFQENELKN